MRRFWKWAGLALAGVAVLGLASFGYLYLASEQVIAQRYPLQPSHLHASTDPRIIASGAHLREALWLRRLPPAQSAGDLYSRFRHVVAESDATGSGVLGCRFRPHHSQGLAAGRHQRGRSMPSDSFQYMTDADVTAIVSYIRSLKPAGADIPEPSYDLTMRWQVLRGTKKMVQCLVSAAEARARSRIALLAGAPAGDVGLRRMPRHLA